ncbi:uncharacterized protein N7500_000572 [Penicillium coprophilum]|uniref:uncharacterized protein n=1 Tax=Penicillium coprophilum TaxID=36646 RepID=UPI0023936039|nr:uncharacterized protein N7500_000572 [Penicillium coprophilum]KAJ5177873.1 hypothetical protein N7500_000572 [Penicillium coprophilum]
MPRGPNSNGRVSKTSAPTQTLNEPNIAALEREITAPNDQVQQQLNTPSARPIRVASKALDEAQEKVLIQWIRQVKELFSLPLGPLITKSANQILNRDGNDATISRAWVERFIKNLPDDLKPPKARSVKKKRLDASDKRLWSIENIYNFDDTIFQIGQGMKPRMIVTSRAYVPPLTRTYCEWITTIECIAADGWAAVPFIVIEGDHYLDEWLTLEGTPDETIFMMNSSGRVDEQVACEWLESFHRQTVDRAADGQPRLLLFRGQPQYLSYKFLEFCEQQKIIPFSFPPNIGHLMQPFDGKPFEDYKKFWRSQGILFSMIDDPDEEKTIFLTDLPSVREKSFKPDVITNAFADRGIVPFDPSKVGQPL